MTMMTKFTLADYEKAIRIFVADGKLPPDAWEKIQKRACEIAAERDSKGD